MPLIKNNKKLLYFIHVPKCAGSAVEDFFIENGAIISFLDRSGNFSNTWYKSSPQHIDEITFLRLFNIDIFDEVFAVVRNPVERFISAYKHTYKFLKPGTDINDFTILLSNHLKRNNSLMGFRDNHFLPMSKLIPEMDSVKIFKLEDGLDSVLRWLDEINFLNINLKSTKISFKNESNPFDIKMLDLNKDSMRFIEDFYENDFKRFNYE